MGATPLHLAAFDGDNDAVNWLLAEGADIEVRTSMDETPLMLAVMRGKIEVVHTLLKWGADINAVPETRYTAIKHAIKGGQARIARLLLERGADLTIVSSKSAENILAHTSAMVAKMVHLLTLLRIRRFHGKAFRRILKQCKKRNDFPKSSLLTLAIQSNDFETVALILENVNLREAEAEKEDFWALDIARRSAVSLEVTRLLLEHGANPQAGTGPFSLLEHAVARQDRELVAALLDAGANTNTAYTRGLLSISELGEDTEMFELLKKRGVTDTCPPEQTPLVAINPVTLSEPTNKNKKSLETQYMEASHRLISSVFEDYSKLAFERNLREQTLERYGDELLDEINTRRRND